MQHTAPPGRIQIKLSDALRSLADILVYAYGSGATVAQAPANRCKNHPLRAHRNLTRDGVEIDLSDDHVVMLVAPVAGG
ncbi:MAG: hypothetical protein LC637_03835 [Xanthomonadaceae bacterium]|nr:hypothetical protein [Xanthomonadaceae bacterium]